MIPILLTVVLATLSATSEAAPTETPPPLPAFVSTGGCSANWSLGFGGYPQLMAAECPDASGSRHASFLSLMDCVSNNEGTLEAKKGGMAWFSCEKCARVEGSLSSITCSCKRTWGAPLNSTLDLETVIRNENGILACFDNLGIEVKSLNDPPA